MFARIAARPITAALTGARVAAPRFNSSSSTSRAARVIEMASQAEKPNAAEAAVPVAWAVTGVLAYTAWNRMSERNASGNVEKLIIV